MKILAAAAVALVAATAHAEPLPVRLKDGATWRQTTVKTRIDEKDGKTESLTVTSIIKATYHQRAGQPATLDQEFVSMSSDEVPPEALAEIANQAKMVFPATVEVDEALTPKRVANWPTLQAQVIRMVSAGKDPAAAQTAHAMFDKIDDKTAANFFKELGLISLGQGTNLDVGEVAPYQDMVPNMFGGPPIRTKGAFKLESYDRAARRAVVTWTQSLDPASASESIRATVEALVARAAPSQAEKAKAELAGLTIRREDNCRYAVEGATGLATTTECSVVLISGAGGKLVKRTDRWSITQTLPEAR